jgi:hypothetical protein
MGATLIAYECSAMGHQPTPDHADKLTIHQGAWAYCSFNALATGHEWRETGGVDLETVMRRGRRAVAQQIPAPATPEP